MAKYELMLVINPSIDEKQAITIADDLVKVIETSNKPDFKNHGLKELAYTINKCDRGYYFQYNFESNNPSSLTEFKRLVQINKNVLRNLLINIEKDYGYRAVNNPIKIKRNKKRAEIFEIRQEEIKRKQEEKLRANKENL